MSNNGNRAPAELVDPDLRQLAALIPDNIIVLDRDERIRFINWTVPDLTVDQVIGTLPYEYIPPEHVDKVRACYRGVLQHGGERRVDMQYVAQDGSESKWETRARPILRGDRVEGVLVVSTNITDRNEAAAERDRFFPLSRDLLCVATLTGYLKRINPAFTQMLGWREEELLAKPLIDFVHPDDRTSALQAMAHLGAGGEVVDFENRVVCASGGYRILHWRGTAPTGLGLIYAVARDITDKRELEARLHQTQKMEAVGQLAGGIAHDFNNLLLAISLNTDLALRKTDDPELAAHLVEAKLAIDRAVDLTRQLLTFARRQPIHVERIDLNLLTGNLMKMLRRTISERIALELAPGDRLPLFRADVVQVEQIVMNLCINARDAVNGSGRIIVGTGVTTIEDSARPGRHVFVSVADDGAGMSAEVRERVFEPFFTTKGPGEGTGLGLAVVHGIVEEHGGFIEVEAQPERGTKFTAYFPADESLDAPAAIPTEPVDAPGGTETILVAEDAVAVRNIVVTVLESAGYRVLIASDGHEAIERVQAHGHTVSLALLDVVMPRLSGPEVAARIRESHPDIRILFTTGYSDTTMLGPKDAAAIVRKPYDPGDLLRRLRAAMDGG